MPVTFGTLTLSGLGRGEDATGLSHPSSRQSQTVLPFRADNATLHDRKNVVHKAKFKITRTFATLGEAFAHLRDHPDAVYAEGKATLTITDTGGPFPEVFVLANALGEVVTANRQGVSVDCEYEFTGETVNDGRV